MPINMYTFRAVSLSWARKYLAHSFSSTPLKIMTLLKELKMKSRLNRVSVITVVSHASQYDLWRFHAGAEGHSVPPKSWLGIQI